MKSIVLLVSVAVGLAVQPMALAGSDDAAPAKGVSAFSSMADRPATSFGTAFVYPRFDSADGLILFEHAAAMESRLRVAPGIGGRTLGAAWRGAKQYVRDGFDTTFQIQITGKHSSGADGLAFVLMNNPEPGMGHSGGVLGFGGLTNLLAIKFDNYHWERISPGNFDEVAVLRAALPTTPLWHTNDVALASQTEGVVFSDGATHTVRIAYAPGTLRVFLDDMENALLAVPMDLEDVVNLDDGRAWVGFTAAGGADWQNHDVISWSFSSAGLFARSTTGGRSAGAAQPPQDPTFYTPADPTGFEVTGLVPDRSFGYALPGGVGLNRHIEVSEDLVNWAPLTNAVFFFRDPHSTNHDARFYRFRIE